MIAPKNNLSHQESLLGVTISGGFINLIIGAIALIVDNLFDLPKIQIEKHTAFLIFMALISIYAIILVWSAILIIKGKKKNQLVKNGPYKMLRHPMYGGVALLLNPALAILFRSWALIEACIVLYFIWKHLAKKEEKKLIEVFGEEYTNYCQETGCLSPKIC